MPKVLIIEDEPIHAQLCMFKLNKCGFEVTCAETVDQGLTLLRQGSFDVVLLDLSLPGKTGWDFLHERKGDSSLINVPVVVLSNMPEHNSRTAKDLGACMYFVKANSSLAAVADYLKKIV